MEFSWLMLIKWLDSDQRKFKFFGPTIRFPLKLKLKPTLKTNLNSSNITWANSGAKIWHKTVRVYEVLVANTDVKAN